MKKNLLLSLFFLMAAVLMAKAQTDVVYKTSSQEMAGKVHEVGVDNVKFSYINEDIIYTIPKAEIRKIAFSSGRVQNFSGATNYQPPAPNTRQVNSNTVAILPFEFSGDKHTSSSGMPHKIQDEVYKTFRKKAIALQFQDPNTTNSLLARAGINDNQVLNHSGQELCEILGVGYVVTGLVSVKYQGARITSNTNKNQKTDRKTTTVTSTDQYKSEVFFKIFDSNGNVVFNDNHKPGLNYEDSYKDALHHLAKKSSLYER